MRKVLRGGVRRIVHVVAKVLKENIENGTDKPVIGIRRVDNPDKVRMVDGVQILGPSILKYTPDNPVPGTDGRGICVLRTSAPLVIKYREEVLVGQKDC